MSRSKYRRYKRDYTELFDNPGALFGEGTETILWPNGEREMYLRSTDGLYGFSIKVSNGPAGFGLTVRALGYGRKADVLPDVGGNHVTIRQYDSGGDGAMIDSVREMEIVQYRPDDRSQQFRRWYRGEGEYPAE